MKHKVKDDAVRMWDASAEGWADFVRTGKDYWRDDVNNPATFKLIGNVKGKTVLDLACGEGYNTRILARKGARVIGVDHSRKLIDLAKGEERKEPLGIRYYRLNATRLRGMSDASFDIVTCFMALHDIEYYESAVAEVSRVLKRGGRFLFSIMHPCFEDMMISGVRTNVAEMYFRRVQYLIEWNMKRLATPFKTMAFHRSLTDYSAVLARNGLLIASLVEPRPTKEAMRRNPNIEKASIRPWSIVLKTVKP